jgi:antirestriction protein ArdC
MASTKSSPKKKYTRKSSTERFDVYQHVTDTITSALDKGVTPWRKPWTNVGGIDAELPRNAVTGREYRGINVFLLFVTSAVEGYSDPRWLTFKQAAARAKTVWLKANGHKDDAKGEAAYMEAVKAGYRGGVRKGEKSTVVTLWKPFKKEVEEDGEKKVKSLLLLKHYYVFNVEQCDGLDLKTIVEEPEAEPEVEFNAIDAADAMVADMPKAPSLSHGGNRAFYRPLTDSVTMPERTAFTTEEGYYATLFHELVHATGHESRLHRVKEWGAFGSEPYAQEELVAEMGGAFLCAMVGIDSNMDQSAAYIGSWAKAIREATAQDKRWLVVAAARAQRAADFILGVQTPDTDQPKNGEAA